jgi:hypothetical protein
MDDLEKNIWVKIHRRPHSYIIYFGTKFSVDSNVKLPPVLLTEVHISTDTFDASLENSTIFEISLNAVSLWNSNWTIKKYFPKMTQ